MSLAAINIEVAENQRVIRGVVTCAGGKGCSGFGKAGKGGVETTLIDLSLSSSDCDWIWDENIIQGGAGIMSRGRTAILLQKAWIGESKRGEVARGIRRIFNRKADVGPQLIAQWEAGGGKS